jgi:hypothetical protein
MSKITLDAALRRLFEQEVRDAPAGHSLENKQRCLSLLKLVTVPRHRWTPEDRQHALDEQCAYCQRMIALSWRDECPRPWDLLWYAASPATSPVRTALAFHLQDDNCAPCQDRLASFRALSFVARALERDEPWRVTRFAERIRDLGDWVLDSLVFLSPTRALEHKADGARTGLRVRGVTTDERLTLTVIWDPTYDSVRAELECTDHTLAGRRVHVELTGERGPEERVAVLEADGPKVRAEIDFGDQNALHASLGEFDAWAALMPAEMVPDTDK